MDEEKSGKKEDEEDSEPDTSAETRVIKPLTKIEKGILAGVPAVLIIVLVLLAWRKQKAPKPQEHSAVAPPSAVGLRVIDCVPEPDAPPDKPLKAVIVTFSGTISSETVNVSTLRLIHHVEGEQDELLAPKSVMVLNLTQARVELTETQLTSGGYRIVLVNPSSKASESSPAHPIASQTGP